MSLYKLVRRLHENHRTEFRTSMEEASRKVSIEEESIKSGEPIKHKSTLIDSANLISISSLKILGKMLEEVRSKSDNESEKLVDDAINLVVSWVDNFKKAPHDLIQDWYTGNAGTIMDQLKISGFKDESRDKRTFKVPANVRKVIYAFDLFLESMAIIFDKFSARQFNSNIGKYEVTKIFYHYLLSLRGAEVSGMDTVIGRAKEIVIEDKDREPEGGGLADTRDSDVHRHIVKSAKNYIKMAEIEARSITDIVTRKISELEANSDSRGTDILKRSLDILEDAADQGSKVIKSNSKPDNDVESGKKRSVLNKKIETARQMLKQID